MSPSYIKEYLEGEVDIFIHKEYHGLIRVKLQSRHVSPKQYLLWIQFSESEISALYCRCRAGARVVGVCFNVSAGIWYLAIGRHNKEAVPSIQDWSDVIDESGESVYSNMVE